MCHTHRYNCPNLCPTAAELQLEIIRLHEAVDGQCAVLLTIVKPLSLVFVLVHIVLL